MTFTSEQLKKLGLPQIEGVLRVSGLDRPVTIVRDRWGCPHINAQNEHDVWFSNGFCHAQDRLWQIERTRRFARGTMSEILGEPLIHIDKYYRRVGIRRVAEHDWPLLNQEARTILQAFSDGVNAGIASLPKLPPEFKVLEIEPEPWTPIDCIAVWKLVLLAQAEDYNSKVFRAAIVQQLGPQALTFLEPEYPEEAPVICPPGSKGKGLGEELDRLIALVNQLTPFSSLEAGSNCWAVDSHLSASGKPLLAGDPHAVVHIAPIWYQNHLRTPDWEMIGVSSPGVPGIFFYGHNGHVAWAGTNPVADIADLFVERFDKSYREYWHRDQWHEAEVWHEEIKVKGRIEPVVEDIPVTVHGPVISGGPLGSGPALALQWTGQEVMRTFECIAAMAKARDVDEFRESQRNWGGSHMNRVTADDSGNIAYQLIGDIPVRAHGGANAVPAPGWTGEYDWVGNIPFDELPWFKNPARHFIATANNRVIPADYKYHVNLTTRPYRAWRIEELLQSQPHLEIQDFVSIQGDRYSRPAASLGQILTNLEPTAETQQALEMMSHWDCILSPESPDAALYQLFLQKLLGRLFSFARGLPGTATSLDSWQVCYLPKLLQQVERDDRSLLELNENTRGMTWQQVILDSLKEAWDLLSQTQGSDPSQWAWGKLHQQTFVHNLGRTPPHDHTFNLPPVGIGGDSTTVFASWASYQSSFTTTIGTSFRMIVDLADLNRSLWILPPGQSGHPGSPHYSDGIQPWLNLEYHHMLWDWDQIKANQEGTLELTPGK